MPSYFDNSTLKLFCACFSGSTNLSGLKLCSPPGLERNLNLTNCLGLLFKRPLCRLEILSFKGCTLDEDLENIDHVTGLSPIMPLIQHIDVSIDEGETEHAERSKSRWHTMSRGNQGLFLARKTTISSSAMCVILRSLAGSIKLRSATFHGYDMTNCLAFMFKEPLYELENITFAGCILSERLESINQVNWSSLILPRIATVMFSNTNVGNELARYYSDTRSGTGSMAATKTQISSPALCFICRALAGSTTLQSIFLDGYDISNCLSYLFSKPLPAMQGFSVENCTLDDISLTESLTSLGTRGNLRGVSSIDLTTCRISNSAARVLCNAISGLRGLKTFKVLDTDLTGCLPLILSRPLPDYERHTRSYMYSRSKINPLTEIEVGGCSFKDSDTSANVQRGIIPGLKTLDLGRCQFVSGPAAQMLLEAVSESDTLTSIVISDVDLSATQPATYKFPALRSLSMEGCLFSKQQISALVQAKEGGYLKCLQYLYLNRAKGLAGSFTLAKIKTGHDEGTMRCFPAPESMIHTCIGLLVLGLKGSDITKCDIQNLAEALSTQVIGHLTRLEINLELCDPDVIGIFQRHYVRLLDTEAKPKDKISPEQKVPK